MKNNIDLDVEKGASYKKQYWNKKQEKSREISRGWLLLEDSSSTLTDEDPNVFIKLLSVQAITSFHDLNFLHCVKLFATYVLK